MLNLISIILFLLISNIVINSWSYIQPIIFIEIGNTPWEG